MARSIFFVVTVFAGVLVGAVLGTAWDQRGMVLGALAGSLFGAAVAKAGLKVGGLDLPSRVH